MNAVVVSFERLPLGMLGCYGSEWVKTPHFDQLATESIVFDQHCGENFDRQAANHAWWTGCYQFPRTYAQQAASTNFLETLRTRDIEVQLLKSSDGDDGFRASQTIFDDWDTSANTQHLLWMQCTGTQRAAPAEWSDAIEQCAAQIAECDAELASVISQIAALKAAPPLLIVTADAGEVIFTRDAVADEDWVLHEEHVHVPLIIRRPDSQHAGSRRPALTQSVDIVPTLADWLGVDCAELDLEGKSLLPLIDGRASAIRERAYLGHLNEQAVRNGDFCLIRSDSAPPRLFLKPEDRFEQADAAREYPDVVDELESALDEFLAGFRCA